MRTRTWGIETHVFGTMDRREFLGAGLTAMPLLFRGWPGVSAREPLALVTADTEAHVAQVSLASGRVRGRLATLEGPRSIQSAAAGGRWWRIRRPARSHCSRAGRCACGASCAGSPNRGYTAIAPGGRWAYVTDSGTGELAVVDLERGRVLRRVFVGGAARHVTLDPAGRTLWIGLGSSAAELSVVSVADPSHPRVVRRVRPPFLAHDVGFSPSGRRVWVTAGRETADCRVRGWGLVAGAAARRRRGAQHVSFGRGVVYVASGEGPSVRVHSLADGRLLRTTKVPYGSYNVQRGGGRVLTPFARARDADDPGTQRVGAARDARGLGGARRVRGGLTRRGRRLRDAPGRSGDDPVALWIGTTGQAVRSDRTGCPGQPGPQP